MLISVVALLVVVDAVAISSFSTSSGSSSAVSSSAVVSSTKAAGGRPAFNAPIVIASTSESSSAKPSVTSSTTSSSIISSSTSATTTSTVVSSTTVDTSSTLSATVSGSPVVNARPAFNAPAVVPAGRPVFGAPAAKSTSTVSSTTTKASSTSTTISSSTSSSATSTSISSKTTSTSTSTSTTTPNTTTSKTSTSTSTTSTSKTTSTTTTSTTSSAKTSTTTTTSASATPTADLSSCWVDYYPSYRIFSGASTTSSTMTPSVCASYCSNAGFEISGTEYGNECYCSHTYPTTWSASCNMKCAGDSTKFCGGVNAMNVVYTAITAASSTGTTSTKRGLAWPWDNKASIFSLFDSSKQTWLYNWELWSPLTGTAFAAAQYIAMVREPGQLYKIAWYFTSTSQVSKYLLGFNEPDLPGDTLVSVSDAVKYWQQYFLPLRKSYGTILGAPAVTNAVASGWGIDWFNQFNAACSDTTTNPGTTKSCFDFIPLHWYGYTLDAFTGYISNFHSVYPNYPIWITEFAFTDHDAASVAILERQALAWLDSQSYVARYSMFGPMNSTRMAGITTGAMLTDSETALTTVGKIYAGLM